ncbi:MAG: YfiR family protein [Desulfobacteraceae bacterium]|nr:YfiR family protein [Desulfobacteraceae bacterium]
MLNNLKASAIFLLIVLCGPNSAYADLLEYEVKAVFLERFTRFIEWPGMNPVEKPLQKFVIGVIGKNPFGGFLEQIYSEKKIKDRKVEIRYIKKATESLSCHLLFISASQRRDLVQLLSFTEDKPILTVGDSKGFAEKGVLINFYMDKRMLRFAINEAAVRKSGLIMDYRLLQFAKIVKPVHGE